MLPALILFGYNAGGEIYIPYPTMAKQEHPDSDAHKGAVEEEISEPSKTGRPNLSGQQGHRDEDEMIKDADTDFPEPGSSPEHSGERG